MNVLMYVTVMLMLLSLLAYSKVESYRSFSSLKSEFISYMSIKEREDLGANNKSFWYDNISFPKQVPEEKKVEKDKNKKTPKPPLPKAKGSSRLSLHLILNSESREKDPEAYKQTRQLFKQLVMQMCGKHEFFQKLIEKQPNFLNELLNRITQLADQSPEIAKMSKVAHLANLKFEDTELDHAMYLMLKGIPSNAAPLQKVQNEEEEEAPEGSLGLEGTQGSDDDIATVEKEESHAPAGFVSILDYITVKNDSKVRVFLASPTLLMAIYGDYNIVEQIVAKRNELLREVRRNSDYKEQASKDFKASFDHAGTSSDFDSILEFSVTTTTPNK